MIMMILYMMTMMIMMIMILYDVTMMMMTMIMMMTVKRREVNQKSIIKGQRAATQGGANVPAINPARCSVGVLTNW